MMKIQCSLCELVEATILCCADELALCWSCDESVHSINNILSKHQRVSLSNSSQPMPTCDICQESIGYFFCLDDRALFCRRCDVSIHTSNNYMTSHQRFLLTGVKVGLVEVGPSNASILRTNSNEGTAQGSGGSQHNQMSFFHVNAAGGSSSIPGTLPSGGGSQTAPWQNDEYLRFHQFNPSYGLMDYNASSKIQADGGKGSDSDGSSKLKFPSKEKLNGETYLGLVGDASWMVVPEMLPPPTSSGMYYTIMNH